MKEVDARVKEAASSCVVKALAPVQTPVGWSAEKAFGSLDASRALGRGG